MIRSFPPHPNPLPPGERGGHSSPQQSWGVFWHIFINDPSKKKNRARFLDLSAGYNILGNIPESESIVPLDFENEIKNPAHRAAL
jgi:hypothetical protein